MAIARLNCPARAVFLLAAAAALGLPSAVQATGDYDDEPPPTLPYYLGRLPAKPPALIFQETFGAPTEDQGKFDLKADLLSLAANCDKGRAPSALLADTDKLLARARLDIDAAACNVLNDIHDLFAAAPPVTGKEAADYIRWRVEHAAWFNLFFEGDKQPGDSGTDDDQKRRRKAAEQALDKLAASPGPLRVHWLYLRGACDYPHGGAAQFQQVVDSFPDHPRAEAARFMLARCALVASRSRHQDYTEPTPAEAKVAAQDRTEARAMFDDYLKRYPKGRFAADVPGWLGALAFDETDYLRALDCYVQQADVPGHPEVLKSAGFMCERCLSRLTAGDNTAALQRVAGHPRLAMSLIYLLVNSPESDNYDGQVDSPAQVARWRQALLPKLAAEVAAHKDAYAGHDWQPRYLAILAQAASGTGDQAKALELCDVGKADLAHSDDLAFIRLVTLARARKLPEAITAGRDFARQFPQSPLAPGAALRLALALADNHQTGVAVAELLRLRRARDAAAKSVAESGEDAITTQGSNEIYPSLDAALSPERSVLYRDTSGAEAEALAQVTDALLNFAPLPELAAGLSLSEGGLEEADAATVRAVLVERWLSEEENFAEAKKYATPAQWSVAAAPLEKLAADVASATEGEARATACQRLADGWAAARGKLLYEPLESDGTRTQVFSGGEGAQYAGVRRRENGLALGLPADRINHALSSRDEWRHAFDWWLKAADAAPDNSPTRARALWAALRAMPSMALVSPFTFLRAGETDEEGTKRSRRKLTLTFQRAGRDDSALSHRLYDRLCKECPGSRETRDFAVYYDLAPPTKKAEDSGEDNDQGEKKTAGPDLTASLGRDSLPYGEPEYRWNEHDENGLLTDNFNDNADQGKTVSDVIMSAAVDLNKPTWTAHPDRMAKEVARLQARLRAEHPGLFDLFLANFLDDLSDFLQEPAAKLTPPVVARYVQLRSECMSVENWGGGSGGDGESNINQTTLAHIREAYRAPEMAAFKDYLDFLALAVVANAKFEVPIPGEMQEAKDGTPGQQEPVTYTSRDYPKLAKLAEGFLKDYPHSRKRDAARLLLARALYAASRPHPREKHAVWPQSGHFAGGTIIVTSSQQKIEPQAIGAALNAYDREFPHGRYAADIRNLRGLLAWRTQDWGIAVSLTLQTMADEHEPSLQHDAERRLQSIFMDGLSDETERRACLTAIKAHPEAVKRLKDFLPGSPYPLQAMQTWVAAQL